MVPVDIPAVADDLGSDQDTVFGRLYYHLDPMYAEPKQDGRARKVFFTRQVGDMVNAVNFPHLEAVLAGLWYDTGAYSPARRRRFPAADGRRTT